MASRRWNYRFQRGGAETLRKRLIGPISLIFYDPVVLAQILPQKRPGHIATKLVHPIESLEIKIRGMRSGIIDSRLLHRPADVVDGETLVVDAVLHFERT